MSRSRMLLLAASFTLVLCGGMVRADDHENPVFPPPDAYQSGTGFGDVAVTASGVDNSAVDARQAVEPQVTALLVLGDIAASSIPVTVSTGAVVDVAAQ
jgi:hypothetical protein